MVTSTEASTAAATSTVETMTDDKLNCHFWSKDRINCSREVYSDPEQWRLSRDYLEHKINMLRIQLSEMKVIR